METSVGLIPWKRVDLRPQNVARPYQVFQNDGQPTISAGTLKEFT